MYVVIILFASNLNYNVVAIVAFMNSPTSRKKTERITSTIVASNTTAGYVIMYIQNDIMMFKNVI